MGYLIFGRVGHITRSGTLIIVFRLKMSALVGLIPFVGGTEYIYFTISQINNLFY
jgi:hypothetical protein